MAYVNDPSKDDQAPNANSPFYVLTGADASTTGGSGGGVAPAPTPTGAAPSAPASPASSGQFINFQQYLDANSGNLGHEVDGIKQSVSQPAQGVQNDLTSMQNAFTKSLPTYGYTGPADMRAANGDAYNNLYGRAQGIQDQAKTLNSQAPLSAYGGSKWDTALLQGQYGGGAFRDIQDKYGNLTGLIDGANADTANKASAAGHQNPNPTVTRPNVGLKEPRTGVIDTSGVDWSQGPERKRPNPTRNPMLGN